MKNAYDRQGPQGMVPNEGTHGILGEELQSTGAGTYICRHQYITVISAGRAGYSQFYNDIHIPSVIGWGVNYEPLRGRL